MELLYDLILSFWEIIFQIFDDLGAQEPLRDQADLFPFLKTGDHITDRFRLHVGAETERARILPKIWSSDPPRPPQPKGKNFWTFQTI